MLIHLALAVGVLPTWLATPAAPAKPGAGLPAIPRASVVVAAKDEERNLPALLASLEAQSLRDFQILLVDDRSRR